MNYSNTKVTLELRDVLAHTDENGNPFKLWDFEYPSYYAGEEKTAFEQKVIDHYLFHQIGCETIGRFKHNFKTRIREIMPYYIQLYKSVEIMDAIEDPFGNVDVIEYFEETTTGTTSGQYSGNTFGSGSTTETATRTDSKTGDENSEHRFSNTPQGSISNIDSYLTEASKDSKDLTESVNSSGTNTVENDNTADTSGTSSSENSGTVTHTLTRKGNQGVNTYAHDMIEFRQSFINVDKMIIDELRDLFLLVY